MPGILRVLAFQGMVLPAFNDHLVLGRRDGQVFCDFLQQETLGYPLRGGFQALKDGRSCRFDTLAYIN